MTTIVAEEARRPAEAATEPTPARRRDGPSRRASPDPHPRGGEGRPATRRWPGPSRLPRPLHPAAWWVWALGMATAASRTTNPLLLAEIAAVVAVVVARRRAEAPWARGLGGYLVLGLVVIAVRVGFRVLLGGGGGTHVLITLPEVPLPEAAAGIRLGGPVTAEQLLAAVYDGMRLACLLLCVGAANLLADPKRLLKAVPGAFHEIGVSVTVALTLAPQLVDSAHRVHRSRALRGTAEGRRHLARRVLLPVLEDALDRSLRLAAAMDSRGYGRRGAMPRRVRALSSSLILLGLVGVCAGTYGILDAGSPAALGAPSLLAGAVLACAGLLVGGRHVRRSVHRPDPWRAPESAVAASGLTVAAALVVIGSIDVDLLNPPTMPLAWPTLALAPALAVLVGALPAVLAPPVAPGGPR